MWPGPKRKKPMATNYLTTYTDYLVRISEQVLLGLTDDLNTGAVDTSIVDEVGLEASADVNSYLGNRYTVPFTSPYPRKVKNLTLDLAVFALFDRRQQGPPKTIEKRRDDAIKFMQAVADGEMNLGEDDPGDSSDSGPEATTVKTDRIFTMGKESDESTGTLDNY